MRTLLATVVLSAATLCLASPGQAGNAVAECKSFFAKFDQCIARLDGEKQDSARIFARTLKAMLGVSDDLNQGDPIAMSIMCGAMIDEAKKDRDVQSYNCDW